MKGNKKLILCTLLIFLGGCSDKYTSKVDIHYELQNASKEYVDRGERVGTGCAVIHVNGKDAQEKLAIKRAIDSVATQKQTMVSSQRDSQTSYHNGTRNNSKVKNTSTHISNTKVSTKVVKILNDDYRICALVVETSSN